ncbi:hypothetical protein AAE478_004277 [Parahypoxylon ruwenzoriense]
MEQTSTPRVSAALIDSYVGRNVIIVGKVLQLRGDTAFIESDGQIQANLNRECHLMVGNGAQIIGKVNPDLSIKVLSAMDLGNNVVTPPTDQLSQLTIREIPQSPQSTESTQSTRGTQPSQPLEPAQPTTQETQYTQYSEESATSSHRKTRSPRSSHPRPTPINRRNNSSSSSKKSAGSSVVKAPAPAASPSPPLRSSSPLRPSPPPPSFSPPSPPPKRRGRLFRTRSGNLVSAAEIRRRREMERQATELQDMILEGIVGDGDERTIIFRMDEVGRWRIVRQEPDEVEEYQEKE